jgi:hypothetical protein
MTFFIFLSLGDKAGTILGAAIPTVAPEGATIHMTIFRQSDDCPPRPSPYLFLCEADEAIAPLDFLEQDCD